MLNQRRYYQQYPTDDAKNKIELIGRIEQEGCVLCYSTEVQDFIAVYDDGCIGSIPTRFVPYSDSELMELFGEGKPEVSLRLIHEAKRLGANVKNSQEDQQ